MACVGDSPVTTGKCQAGQEFSCTCPSGQTSTQVCNKDGTGYDPCQCAESMDSSIADGGGGTNDVTNPIPDTSTGTEACVPLTQVEACTNPDDAGLPYCGSHSDNCGGTINCGSSSQCGTVCTSGETCLTTQVCGHSGGCNWKGYELCNTQPDLCGGTISCGSCNYGSCYLGQICICGKDSSYDGDCSGGSPHAYHCISSGTLSSPCTLVDSTNHVYCCP